jgi:hypothetical protein
MRNRLPRSCFTQAPFARTSRSQRQHYWSFILYPFSKDNNAAMRVNEHCLAFFMKVICRI